MLETFKLTKENKKYIRKQTLTFSFYLTLFLCLYFMIFAPDPAIIAICSLVLFWFCFRRLVFMLCIYCNNVDTAPIIIKDKKIKRGFGGGGRYPGGHSHGRYNRFIYILLPSGWTRREKVDILRYSYVNIGDNGVIFKTVFMNKSFTFNEFVFNEYTDTNRDKTFGADAITPEEFCQKYSKPNEHVYYMDCNDDVRF